MYFGNLYDQLKSSHFQVSHISIEWKVFPLFLIYMNNISTSWIHGSAKLIHLICHIMNEVCTSKYLLKHTSNHANEAIDHSLLDIIAKILFF